MMLVPAVDVMDGECVQLVGGDPRELRVSLPDPVGAARGWVAKGAKRLHVIDLDAALGRGDNESLVRDIVGAVDVPVQVGGGVRSDAKAERLLLSGAAQVIVGTRALVDGEWLGALAGRYPGRVVAAVDARGSEITFKGWTEGASMDVYEFARSLKGLPLFGILYTNVEVEGSLKGVDPAPVRKLRKLTGGKLMAAGGIGGEADLAKLEKAGADAAILGMSIYKEKVDFRKAVVMYDDEM